MSQAPSGAIRPRCSSTTGRTYSGIHHCICRREKAGCSSSRIRRCSGSSMPIMDGPMNALRLWSYQVEENVSASRRTSVQAA
jgi:hypothetical protein